MNHLGTERACVNYSTYEKTPLKVTFLKSYIYMYKNMKSSKDRLINGEQTYLQQTGTTI